MRSGIEFTRSTFLRGQKVYPRKRDIYISIIYDTRHILPTKERHNVQFKVKRTTIEETHTGRLKTTILETRQTARILSRE